MLYKLLLIILVVRCEGDPVVDDALVGIDGGAVKLLALLLLLLMLLLELEEAVEK